MEVKTERMNVIAVDDILRRLGKRWVPLYLAGNGGDPTVVHVHTYMLSFSITKLEYRCRTIFGSLMCFAMLCEHLLMK